MDQPLRILMVAASSAQHPALQDVFNQDHLGVTVEPVLDQAAFARSLESGHFDLALVDQTLPWADSLALVRNLKDRYPDRPAILLVDSYSEALAAEALQSGIDDVVETSADRRPRLRLAVRSACRMADHRRARHQSETALRDSQSKYRVLIEHLAPITYIAAADDLGSTIYISPQIQTVLGVSPERWQADSTLWSRLLHPDDRPRVLSEYQRAVADHTSFDSEYRMIAADGRIVWFHDMGKVTQTGPSEPPRVHGIMVDITNRKHTELSLRRTEQRLRAVLNATTETVLLLDPDGKILLANATVAGRLGQQVSEMEGTDVFALLPPEPAALRRAKLAEAVRTRQSLRFEDRQGGRTLDSTIYPLLNPQDGTAEVAVFANDITARRQAEQALKAHTAQLEALSQRLVETQEQERRHLARELHDQVGQALTAIQIHLHSLRASDPSPAHTKLLEEGLDLVGDLIRRTQDLSLSLRPSMLDDIGLPAALKWYTEQQAARAGLHADLWVDTLQGRLAPDIETACFRVVQEALTNVLRHAQASEVTVELRCEDHSLHLVVHDDGKGFDVPACLARTGPDASLGLIGMQERVSLLGGRFECRSSAAQGTAVHAWLPLTWRT
jgi:PAS domain S-box-containing protein